MTVPEAVINAAQSRKRSKEFERLVPPPAEEEDLGSEEETTGFEGEGGYGRVRLPDQRNKEIFALADTLMGASRIAVNCQDGKSRMGRIPGKMKKRQWIRPGDLLIVKPWDFQPDKCDVKFRYTRTQAVHLSRRKLLPESMNIF